MIGVLSAKWKSSEFHLKCAGCDFFWKNKNGTLPATALQWDICSAGYLSKIFIFDIRFLIKLYGTHQNCTKLNK